MKFKLLSYQGKRTERDVFYLTHTSWDDWFKYATMYQLDYLDREGHLHWIGTTKIGKFGLQPATAAEAQEGERSPDLPQEFTALTDDFFSLGQDPEFYENLNALDGDLPAKALKSLRDIAYDLDLLRTANQELVTQESLLRNVPLFTVEDQLNRLAHGGLRLTSYNLKYTLKYTDSDPEPVVEFKVEPNSTPPTNIHVLIGRNGVGKTTFLNLLAQHLVKKKSPAKTDNAEKSGRENSSQVSNLVSVSFSAFDTFEPLTPSVESSDGLSYHYVGIKNVQPDLEFSDSVKGPKALAKELAESSRICLQGERRKRWVDALRLLESDPLFEELGIADTVEDSSIPEEALTYIASVYDELSSGHKIVLLTITRLVETVEEKSLVLIDEPEGHLHPPLLSAFTRALSNLLINRNGVAIVATHSPVVLQEVPRTCVWKIARLGRHTTIERPQLETFGENVGTLTNEVFGLEVTSTGFHKMLQEAAYKYRNYDAALASFDGQIGSEGKAILRAITSILNSNTDVVR